MTKELELERMRVERLRIALATVRRLQTQGATGDPTTPYARRGIKSPFNVTLSTHFACAAYELADAAEAILAETSDR